MTVSYRKKKTQEGIHWKPIRANKCVQEGCRYKILVSQLYPYTQAVNNQQIKFIKTIPSIMSSIRIK